MKKIVVVALLVILLITNGVTLFVYLDTRNQLQVANQQIASDKEIITELDTAYRQFHDEIENWERWSMRTIGYIPTTGELAK